MSQSNHDGVSELLERVRLGDASARDSLFERVYRELHEVARRVMAHQRPGHTLQPTALVNEAYLKLLGAEGAWENRKHFLNVSARAMRSVLVDHARARATVKRGGVAKEASADLELVVDSTQDPERLLALDDQLHRLASLDEQTGHVAELRLFGGLSLEEIARCLSISTRTVERAWRTARAWLAKQLEDELN
jgi:RNA polymerase sigma factor (TIGR02999 family)